MKRFIKIVAFVLLTLQYPYTLWSQTTSVPLTGVVFNSQDNKPLEGVSIIISKTNLGTMTSADGSFKIALPQNARKITVSYTGFKPQEIDIAGRNSVSVSLSPEGSNLDEIVITGYSVQNKKFIAGSVSTVNEKNIKDIPASSFNELLQGKAAGVEVSSNTGVPGGGLTFRVRGSNSINASVDPLYIVDGVFISNTNEVQTAMGGQLQSNPLADINPSDIESITILKDANATAIYGSLGANGVVIVNTKRGHLNSKAKINLNVAHGWSNAIRKFKVTDGPTTGKLVNESLRNTAIDNGIDPSTIVYPFDPDTLQTYDRVDGLFRTANTSNYEISAQGGTARSTYYTGFSYLKQQSIVKPSDFERYTARFNFDNRLTDFLKIGTSINISRTWRNVSSNDNNPVGVINSAIFPRSYVPIFKPDGTFNRAGSFDNHLALIENLDNNAVGWRTIANVFAELNLARGLKFRSSVSIDNNDMYENDYSNTLITAGIATNGSAASYENKNFVFTNEQVLTFIRNLGANGQHNINALIGNTVNTVQTQNTTATGQGFATNNIKAISDAATRLGSSSQDEARLISFFGKASYTYNQKYTLDASLRADASSKFGVNSRWGYFPSGGITWRASEEPFIRDLNIFDELKIRVSEGLTGNQNGIGPYAAMGLWSSGANYLETAGTAPTQIANPNLSWETTRQTDIGADFSILDNRVSVSVDYYDKYTYDLLLNVPVPSRLGFSTYLQNFGAVRNKGWEFAVHTNNVQGSDLTWTTDFNISFNRNKIEKLAADIALGASGRNLSILREGYSINSFQLYKQLYVDPETGNAVYEDVNHDGVITSADRQIVGNALPKFTGGLTNTLTYKNFDLNFFFYFQQGNKILNMQDFFLVHGGTQNYIGFVPRQEDRWQQPGDITDIPRLTTTKIDPTKNGGGANNYGGSVANQSSRYLADGSYIRLRNISIGYNLPEQISNKAKLSNIRVHLDVANLLTFTKYDGLDPEVSAQGGNQNTAGYDWATVPHPRTIQAGLNITF